MTTSRNAAAATAWKWASVNGKANANPLGRLGDELDLARVLVGSAHPLAVVLQLADQLRASGNHLEARVGGQLEDLK
jgi:hypothetical protein